MSCAGCHGGAGEQLCVGCHKVGGPGGNPHGAGFASHKDKRRDVPWPPVPRVESIDEAARQPPVTRCWGSLRGGARSPRVSPHAARATRRRPGADAGDSGPREHESETWSEIRLGLGHQQHINDPKIVCTSCHENGFKNRHEALSRLSHEASAGQTHAGGATPETKTDASPATRSGLGRRRRPASAATRRRKASWRRSRSTGPPSATRATRSTRSPPSRRWTARRATSSDRRSTPRTTEARAASTATARTAPRSRAHVVLELELPHEAGRFPSRRCTTRVSPAIRPISSRPARRRRASAATSRKPTLLAATVPAHAQVQHLPRASLSQGHGRHVQQLPHQRPREPRRREGHVHQLPRARTRATSTPRGLPARRATRTSRPPTRPRTRAGPRAWLAIRHRTRLRSRAVTAPCSARSATRRSRAITAASLGHKDCAKCTARPPTSPRKRPPAPRATRPRPSTAHAGHQQCTTCHEKHDGKLLANAKTCGVVPRPEDGGPARRESRAGAPTVTARTDRRDWTRRQRARRATIAPNCRACTAPARTPTATSATRRTRRRTPTARRARVLSRRPAQSPAGRQCVQRLPRVPPGNVTMIRGPCVRSCSWRSSSGRGGRRLRLAAAARPLHLRRPRPPPTPLEHTDTPMDDPWSRSSRPTTSRSSRPPAS